MSAARFRIISCRVGEGGEGAAVKRKPHFHFLWDPPLHPVSREKPHNTRPITTPACRSRFSSSLLSSLPCVSTLLSLLISLPCAFFSFSFLLPPRPPFAFRPSVLNTGADKGANFLPAVRLQACEDSSEAASGLKYPPSSTKNRLMQSEEGP